VPEFNSRITLKDVAKKVGVSVNAASKVLNNTRSSGQVSQATRGLILEAARELGYQPHSAARSLVRRRSDVVALYFDRIMDTGEPFTAALIEGAELGCRRRQQSLLLYSRGPEQTVDDACRKLLSGIADGIVTDSWLDIAIMDRLLSAGIPVIQYPESSPRLPCVMVDESTGARQAVAHLAERGHRRFYFRSYPRVDTYRVQSYANAAKSFGIEFSVIPAADGYGFVSDAERELLKLPRDKRPTAAVCWNDEFAFRMVNYCIENNIRIPGELAIVGYDGARTFPEPVVKITTVDVPWTEVASRAVSLLVDVRDGKDVPMETLLPVTLTVGDTT
jgi:DNA-binding LacI/PurR family transcriptional regulator